MILDPAKRVELEAIGGPEFYLELIDKFISQSREIILDLDRAREGGQKEEACKALHRIKGSCSVVGAAELFQVVALAYAESKEALVSAASIDAIRAMIEEAALERARL